MRGMRRAFWLLLILPLSIACSGTNNGGAQNKPAMKKEAPADNGGASMGSDTEVRGDMTWSTRAFPTGNRRTSAVLIERGAPTEVILGQDYEYVIKVTNLTDGDLENVVVNETPGANLKISSSEPKASGSGGNMSWNLGNLGARKSKMIRVRAAATSVGSVEACCEATWQSVVCSTTRVVQPKLSLVKTGTAETLICDPIVYKLTVTNGGTGPAKNVVINDNLPAGVTTLSGKKTVRINVGTLNAGQSKNYSIRAKATKTGSFQNSATATATGLSAKSGTVTTKVTAPKLTIEKTGTRKTFIGRNIDYTIKVTNTGNGVAKDTVVTDPVPAGTRFLSASDGGALNGGVVTWDLGTLQPGGSRTLTMRVKSGGESKVRNTATAKAYCADAVSATHETSVTGIPAVLLEVIDVEDPIEVGQNVTYVITVTNQGSAQDTNIRIVAQLEDAQEYVSNAGATRGSHSGGTITFEPLPSLAPKAKATWRITVKARAEGDIRFKVTMNTDELKRPVQETEATNFYK